MNLTLPLPLAWFFAVLGLLLPVLIIINPGGYFGLTGTFGICSLGILVYILVLFLGDVIASKIRYKAFWIVAILLVPSLAQLAYLICRKNMIQ
jgi:hypothetical protein